MIAFAAFHLEGDLLLATNVLDDIGHDGGTGHGGGTHGDLAIVVDQKNAVKGHRLPGFNRQTINFQRIARAHAILFATRF